MSQNGNHHQRFDAILTQRLDRRKSRSQLRALTTVPVEVADFSSNAYLSLSTNPTVQAAFLARLHQQAGVTATAACSTSTKDSASLPSLSPIPRASPLLGSGGSRLLDGNSPLAERLERSIAAFHGASAGLLFNSAMDANLGLFGCVPQPGDAIVYDELIHASVHDGMRLQLGRAGASNGKRIPFAHNRIWSTGSTSAPDGTENTETPRYFRTPGAVSGSAKPSLETVLQNLQSAGTEGGHLFRSGERNIFIAVEGVYSMDGDVAPLADVVECVERTLGTKGNGYIIVDEAHSTGVLGDRGRGLVCELGLEDRVWARVLGFGKAMGCSGGAYFTLSGLSR